MVTDDRTLLKGSSGTTVARSIGHVRQDQEKQTVLSSTSGRSARFGFGKNMVVSKSILSFGTDSSCTTDE